MKQTIEVDLKWFHFGQNNSGGSFVVNENCAPDVWVQARNAKEAVGRAEAFMDNGDSCPCCGDRWSFWMDDSDGTEVPMRYETPVSELTSGPYRDQARLHHFDGRVEAIVFPQEPT